jgi:hypothetical protein
MAHVSALLPGHEHDEQRLERKVRKTNQQI